MNNIFDLFVDFTRNIANLFNWLFFEQITFTINGNTYEIIPIGLLIGGIGLTIGIIRRIL